MKKFYLSLLVLLAIILIVVFYPKKPSQNQPLTSAPIVKTDEDLKQLLVETFKNYRESLYKIKQLELTKASEQKADLKKLKNEVCVKMAYDLDAFIMRARLRPQSIEKKECKKLNQMYQEISSLEKLAHRTVPSYTKRLNQDLTYFTEEINKQEFKNDELNKKIKDFQQEIARNRLKLKKITKTKKTSNPFSSKCMKTILLHRKEFSLKCKT